MLPEKKRNRGIVAIFAEQQAKCFRIKGQAQFWGWCVGCFRQH
jgi:hypothetical protein